MNSLSFKKEYIKLIFSLLYDFNIKWINAIIENKVMQSVYSSNRKKTNMAETI